MNREPTTGELFDAILNLQDAMLRGFNVLDGRMTRLETRMTTLENRFHEFDEDFQSFRIEVNARFDRLEAA